MLAWLRKEPRTISHIYYLLLGAMLCIGLLEGAGTYLLGFFHSIEPQDEKVTRALVKAAKSTPVIITAFVVIYPLAEELVFRIIPLFATVKLTRRNKWCILAISILSSVAFGWMHGSIAYVLTQGMQGLVTCAVFLKCGGFRGALIKPALSVWTLHVMINGSIFLAVLFSFR